MESWNVEPRGKYEYSLLNPARTLITVNQRADVDLGWITGVLEEIGFPLGYTSELEEIRFTWVKNCGGYYLDNKVWVAPHIDRALMVSNLIHEIGHHVEEMEDLTERESLIREKKERGHLIDDTYSQKNIYEYIACGFQVYYCGTTLQKKNLRKNNPKLYNVINWLHRKYKAR